MKSILLIAAFAASQFLSPEPTRAQTQAQAQENVRSVITADLDLSRERDVRRLDRRIAIAAAWVCGPVSDADPVGKNATRRCRKEAAANVAAARARAIGLQTKPRPTPLVAAR